ncbi:UDP-glucose 4-epimerase family protein [Aeromonas sp. HMWF014]|uniref:UDP-glucose 4-epimerase family protein n=1 Tax=Aeromonas sp. HMWF014 TaxID=2056850 RepID=UPI000D3A358B|nr:SDR family oxidoreductase [Aeromonas sp. HMWF014]PTT56236.1 UDP-glucose 4-epimerase [Aeromonas sp. HMWF014]
MKVLITGATGFVGSEVLKVVMQQLDTAVCTYGSRPPASFPVDNTPVCTHVIGRIGALTDYSHALFDVDVVIHCAAQAHVMNSSTDSSNDIYHDVNVEGTLNLARQAISANVKRFIFISSIKVNGESTNYVKSFSQASTPSPEDAYGRSKQAAEDGLRTSVANSGMELVIIRPPLVYGRGVKGNFCSLLKIAKRNLPLPLGAIHNQRSMVALDNLVDLIITCVTHPHAANQTFLVSDDEDISTTQLLEMIIRAAGKSPRLLPVPMSWLRLAGKLTGKQAVIERLCGNLQVDIVHTKATLGWQPPISVEEGIKCCFIEDKEGC